MKFKFSTLLIVLLLTSCNSINETYYFEFLDKDFVNSQVSNDKFNFDCNIDLKEIYSSNKEKVFLVSSNKKFESLKENYFIEYSYCKIYAYNEYGAYNSGDPLILSTLSSNSKYKGYLEKDTLFTSYYNKYFGFIDKTGLNINNEYIVNFNNLINPFQFSNHTEPDIDNQYVFGEYFNEGISSHETINSSYLFNIKNDKDFKIEVNYYYKISFKNNDKKYYECNFKYLID